MKKMIIAACAVFALTSCSDFLEETPVGELTPEQAQDPNNIEGLIISAYSIRRCSAFLPFALEQVNFSHISPGRHLTWTCHIRLGIRETFVGGLKIIQYLLP